MGVFLIGLLGMLVLSAAVSDSPEIDDEPDEMAPDEVPDEELGREILFDGSVVLEGTEGDDTIPAGQGLDLAPEEVNLFAGDDVADLDEAESVSVFGGEGDDTLSSSSVLNALYGEAGSDTLTADDSNRLFGGEGNDVINFFHGSYDQGDTGIADGGAGDDVINVRADALFIQENLFNVGGVDIRGGEGEDEINIFYDLSEPNASVPEPPTEGAISRGFLALEDFNPDEDTLTIEIEADAENADRLVTVRLDQSEEDGTYTSLITFTFAATDIAPEGINILTVRSEEAITLDDIEFVGV